MSKFFINTDGIMSFADNHEFIIKWWLSSDQRIHWVRIRSTSDTFLCSKCVYKAQILDEAVNWRSRTNSKLNCLAHNEKLTLEKLTWNLSLYSSYFKILKLTLFSEGPITVWAISPGKYQNFRNLLENINNSKFLSGRLKLATHNGEVEYPNLFHRRLIL